MKRFLIGLVMLSFVMASLPEKGKVEREVGRYQISTITTTYKEKIYVVETILDTKTGMVVRRRKISLGRYKLPYKDGKKIIREE